jgi:spermidine synthase
LHFDSPWIQGAMRIDDPFHLELDYTQAMMAALAVQPRPAHVLQLGLGAASLTKACWKLLPRARITVVENSAAVIQAAVQHFALPIQSPRLQIIQEDALRALNNLERAYDLIQIDLYDRLARAPVHGSSAFYRACVARLTSSGAMAVNLFGHPEVLSQQLPRIERAFVNAAQVRSMPPGVAGNVVVLGIGSQAQWPSRHPLRQQVQHWTKTLGWRTRGWVQALDR